MKGISFLGYTVAGVLLGKALLVGLGILLVLAAGCTAVEPIVLHAGEMACERIAHDLTVTHPANPEELELHLCHAIDGTSSVSDVR